MKKILCIILSLLITVSMISGCSLKNDSTAEEISESTESPASENPSDNTEPSSPEDAGTVPASEESSAEESSEENSAVPASEESSEESPAPAPEESSQESPAPAPEESSEDTSQNRFVFQPKVCSAYIEEIFGETMCETWYNLVDAVMAGENTFACPDEETYGWVIGQFPDRCFPVLLDLIEPAYDRNHPVKDGVASFTWLVPPEEAAIRIEEFSTQIEGILNEALETDYSDCEKALALYDYFYRNYVYDYDTFELMYKEFVDLRTIDFFTRGTGVCQQISNAYSYLLMQTGTDATIMMGGAHQWSYVRINGHNYHIDPTFAITNNDSLAYFMMTDEQREATGFDRDSWTIASVYTQDHPHPDYVADDNTFQPVWEKYFQGLAPKENILHCAYNDESDEWTNFEFDYTGF